jgi:hypothetical protein
VVVPAPDVPAPAVPAPVVPTPALPAPDVPALDAPAPAVPSPAALVVPTSSVPVLPAPVEPALAVPSTAAPVMPAPAVPVPVLPASDDSEVFAPVLSTSVGPKKRKLSLEEYYNSRGNASTTGTQTSWSGYPSLVLPVLPERTPGVLGMALQRNGSSGQDKGIGQ